MPQSIKQGYLMLFVFIAVFCYGVLNMISQWISSVVGHENVVSVVSISLFLIVILFFMRKNETLKKNKICFPQKNGQCLRLMAPLFVVPILNVILANSPDLELITEDGRALLVLFWGLSAFSEELLFRGVLPNALLEQFQFSAVQRAFAVNVIFALLHLGNALSGTSLWIAIAQSVLAFSIGFCFSGIIEITGSLFPAVCMHWFINLSSSYRDTFISVLSLKELLIWLGVSILFLCYGTRLIKKIGGI